MKIFQFKMPFYFLILTALLSSPFAREINIQDGFIAEGYDLVSYFEQKAVKGKSEFKTTYQGVQVQFSSQANLDKFKAAPEKYWPQYGGWCAYAMGVDGSKVEINPKTFEIRDGKLYLFYNAFFINTLTKWQDEGAEKLRSRADSFWKEN